MRYQDRFVYLTGLLILISIVAIWSGVADLLAARRPGSVSGVGLLLRLLREGILVMLLLDAALTFLRRRQVVPVSRWAVLFWSFAFTYVVIVASISLGRGLFPVVVLAGLRMFEYVPLIFVAYVVSQWYDEEVFARLGKVLVWYVVIESIIATVEIFTMPHFIHGKTFLGARPFGTLALPNQFGATMAICALYLALLKDSRYHKWTGLCALMALASGSRAAMIAIGIVLAYLALLRLRGASGKVALAVLAVPALGLVYLAASSEALSGRAIEGEARLELWREILANVKDPADLLIGWGVGLGSNTVSNLFGREAFPGQYMADSFLVFLLGSYGLIGLTVYLGALLVLLWRHHDDLRIVVVIGTILFFSTIKVVWEAYPVNAILAIILGWLLGSRHAQVRQAPERELSGIPEAYGAMQPAPVEGMLHRHPPPAQ